MPKALTVLGVVLCLLACSQSKSGSKTQPAPATPELTPIPTPSSDQQAALEAINRARSTTRTCQDAQLNKGRYAAAKAVSWNRLLEQAAQAHAQDMRNRRYFAHQHPQGPNLQMRLEQVGYRWRAIGENIAAGQPTLTAVVNAWLASAGHCAIIMGQDFTEMGLARADGQADSPHKVYWVLNFAAPLTQR